MSDMTFTSFEGARDFALSKGLTHLPAPLDFSGLISIPGVCETVPLYAFYECEGAWYLRCSFPCLRDTVTGSLFRVCSDRGMHTLVMVDVERTGRFAEVFECDYRKANPFPKRFSSSRAKDILDWFSWWYSYREAMLLQKEAVLTQARSSFDELKARCGIVMVRDYLMDTDIPAHMEVSRYPLVCDCEMNCRTGRYMLYNPRFDHGSVTSEDYFLG